MSLEGGNGLSNEQADRALIAELEKSSQEFASKNPEMAIWLHDHLHRINMRGLRGAFRNVIERVHGNLDSERVVPPERTYVVNDDSEEGHHHDDIQSNSISGPLFLGLKELSPLKKMARLLDLICHENSHATGRISHTVLSEDVTEWQIGYANTSAGGILFNEGMTEIVSQRVAREYLIGYPIILEDGSTLDVEAYQEYLDSYHAVKGTPANYAAARDFVRVLCIHLAEALSTTPELVEDALVAGYFRGTEEFFDRDFLDSVLGSGFSGQLRAAQTAADLKRIIHEYQMPPLKTATYDRMVRLIQKSQES